MRALLLFPDRDFDLKAPPFRNDADLSRDLGIETLVGAMAAGDPFLAEVARATLLANAPDGVDGVLFRQEALEDGIRNADVVRAIYALASETLEARKRHWFGVFMRYPGGILRDAVELMQMFLGSLRKLRALADGSAPRFRSRAFTSLFATLRRELDDTYLSQVADHLRRLGFHSGVVVSARLGVGNEGVDHVLHEVVGRRLRLWERIFGERETGLTIHIAERDEAGAKALGELRDRGINDVANVLAQSTDHVNGFFDMLRKETAFYVGCLNLRDRLTSLGAPTCLPRPHAAGGPFVDGTGLYDTSLAIAKNHSLVGNDVAASSKGLIVITGANQGGKSSFLRAVGLGHLMMQAGMFVGAQSFASSLCTGIFTHYRREEDERLRSGKLDEELRRMSAIADVVRPGALVLFNESFSATNEREGSEIARQVVSALLERRIRVAFVTHLHGFASELHGRRGDDVTFLRAERRPDGSRPFRLVEAAPLETSYGADVYREVFFPGDTAGTSAVANVN